MRWEVDRNWSGGKRWRLIDDTGRPVGRVIRYNLGGACSAWHYDDDQSREDFANLREAAVWLLEQITLKAPG